MRRGSARASSFLRALQISLPSAVSGAISAPVSGSLAKRKARMSPCQLGELLKLGRKIQSSPVTGVSVLVPAPAPEPLSLLISLIMVLIASASESGLLAEKYWPRPLTAACHRSSMWVASP